jgi:Alpha/beta hydrolase domain
MGYWLEQHRLWLATISIFLATTAFFGLVGPAGARITEIDVMTNTPAFDGANFGAGQYQMINGTVKGEVDPDDPLNAVIVDISLAPRNAHGMVEYSTDFQLLLPTDLKRGNNRLLYEITNRGSTNALTILNSAKTANTKTSAPDPGNGFLMNQGYAILESGWDITVAPTDPGFGVTVPVATKGGKPITGAALEEFDIDSNASLSTQSLSYTAASADKSQASLSVRANFGDKPITLDASVWDYTDSSLTAIKLNPPGTNFGDPSVFGPSGLYEFSYQATNPKVAGLGFAVLRDLATFFRRAKTDDNGNPNPLAGNIKFIYTFCSSQPCRTMHDFVLLGFNEAEHAKNHGTDAGNAPRHMAFDGVLNWKAGGSGIYMNYRFAQPTRTHRQHIARWYPEVQFPFANETLHDSVTHQTDGRLAACQRSNTCPKIFEANSANEYWAKAGSLLTTDTQGHDLDLDHTPDVRYYLFASQPHGAGPASPLSKGLCQQFENPIRPDPVLRALLFDLDEWVSSGREPPKNRVPRRSNGTLVASLPQSAEGFPNIPAVTYNGILHTGDLWDFGPKFDDGIVTVMPPNSLGTPYPALVPKTDADGNDIAGIRVPDVAAPLATFTGWGLRATPLGETGNAKLIDGCDANGQIIPFAATKAERGADPRPSLQERYGNPDGTNANYVAAVKAAADKLVKDRFLLELPGVAEDVETYTTPAGSVAVPSNP